MEYHHHDDNRYLIRRVLGLIVFVVGYGDYFAKTVLGRIVIFMVSIWGTTVVSLMVVTLTNIFQMSRLEGKVTRIIVGFMLK